MRSNVLVGLAVILFGVSQIVVVHNESAVQQRVLAGHEGMRGLYKERMIRFDNCIAGNIKLNGEHDHYERLYVCFVILEEEFKLD